MGPSGVVAPDVLRKRAREYGLQIKDEPKPPVEPKPLVNKSPRQNWFIRWLDRITPAMRG